jgi:ankyrin repeat protein
LDRGASIDARTRSGLTPLLIAARKGHEAVAICLLESGVDISSRDAYVNNALLCATAAGKTLQ